MIQGLPPWQGIGIPTAIISTLGYGSHYFIFTEDLSKSEQIWFQCCLTALWISYLIAICKSPGSPPKDFQPKERQWRRWCKKCELYKPERAHHCKTCKKCVLKMDHHCPWTANCVGHENLPHFLRFLLCVDYTNGYCLYHLCKRLKNYWYNRDLPIYLISKTNLTMTIILTPLSIMVAITVGILTFRCFYNILFGGMTQIEVWEHERIESQLESGRLYPVIKRNYKLIFGKELKSLISWSTSHSILRDSLDETDALNIGIDDLVFPYDVNPWENLINAFGYPWNWFLPWGGPRGDGLTFEKNEILDSQDQDLSSLPWPPDGNHQDRVEEVIGRADQIIDEVIDENERLVRRRTVSPESDLRRSEWRNDFGEKLSDFGVDVDAEG